MDEHYSALITISVLFPFGVLSLFLINKHDRLYSSYLSCISGLGSVLLLVWIFGGFGAPSPQWVTMSPLVFGMFFGKKSIPASVFFMISCFLVFYFIESPVQLSPEEYQEEKMLNLFLQAFLMPVVVYAFVSSIDDYQDDLRGQNFKNKKLLRVLLHDISNPLTVIKLITRRIKSDIDPKHARKLEVNTAVIANILEEVKSYSQQDNNEKLFQEIFFAGRVLEDVASLFDEFANRKGVVLEVENFLDDTIKLKSNLGLLQSQIIYNLVSNAIKFTPEGGKVTVRSNSIDNFTIFEILDEGTGIDLSKVLFLDEDIKSQSSIGTDGEVGNGYGLGLVSYFLKKLDGELTVLTSKTESSIEKGTLFRVCLPLYLS